jgi:hypothetical protein
MAGENDDYNDGGSDDFSDLPGLGKDGGDSGTQQDQIDEGGKLDKLLDDHIGQTSVDSRAPAQGADKKGAGDGTQQRRSQQGDGQQRDVRGQGQDDRRGQGDGQRSAAGTASHTPRQLTSLFKSGADGAIYDANGTKVANGGLERRVAERVLGYYRGMETEHNALKQRMDAYEGANTAAREAGLSIEEHAMGMRLMSAWKVDPLKTINYLLTQAQARNIDVTPIRQGSGFDPAAVDSLLEKRFKALEDRFAPLLSNIEQQREDAEIRDQVQTEITAFFEEFPTAEMHRPVLGAIMQKTGYTPREAWFAVQAEAAKAGWDLTKPLPGQAQASHGNGAGNGAASTGVGRTRNLPDMSGRGAGGGTRNARTVRAGSREVAGVDTSYDDIISDVLAEQGQQQ